VDGVRVGIVVKVGVIGIVEGSTARVEAGIVSDKVSVVREKSGVERAYTIEREVVIEVWCFRDNLLSKNESNKKSKFILNSDFFLFSLLSLFFLFSF
jgi:hypothetical protein